MGLPSYSGSSSGLRRYNFFLYFESELESELVEDSPSLTLFLPLEVEVEGLTFVLYLNSGYKVY